MFSNKRRRAPAISTLVGRETRVHGDLEFTGSCLVDGYVKGNVKASTPEHAAINISEQGCIEGSVEAPTIFLNGTVKGDVRATERIELGSNARVIGNVQYRLIEMAIGAEVNGKLMHESEAGAQDDADASLARPRAAATLSPVASVNVAGESS